MHVLRKGVPIAGRDKLFKCLYITFSFYNSLFWHSIIMTFLVSPCIVQFQTSSNTASMSALRCWYRIDQTLPDRGCWAQSKLRPPPTAWLQQSHNYPGTRTATTYTNLSPAAGAAGGGGGDLWHFLETCDIMQDCVPSTYLCPGLTITWRVVSRVTCHVESVPSITQLTPLPLLPQPVSCIDHTNPDTVTSKADSSDTLMLESEWWLQ